LSALGNCFAFVLFRDSLKQRDDMENGILPLSFTTAFLLLAVHFAARIRNVWRVLRGCFSNFPLEVLMIVLIIWSFSAVCPCSFHFWGAKVDLVGVAGVVPYYWCSFSMQPG